jgi:hypothetical protein
MPAKNPRLTITLKPALAARLRKLSDLTGNSQSSMIAELLEGTEPVFDKMIEVLQAAQAAQASMRGKIANDMEQAQTKMEGALGVVMQGFDQFTDVLIDESKAVQRRARRVGHASAAQAPRAAPAAASPTPLSNRGVRSLTNTTKNIAQGQLPAKPKPKKEGAKSRGVGT